MPKQLPPDIAELVREFAPPGHQLVWIRVIPLKPPAEIERPPLKSQLLLGRKPPIDHDTVLELRDIDTGEGWDARLVGVGHDIAMGDIFSALSSVPPGEGKVRKLAFLYNHKTGIYQRVHEDISTAGTLLNELAYKRVLSFWEPATPASRAAALRATLHGYYTSRLTPQEHRLRNLILTLLIMAFLLLLWALGPGGLSLLIGKETFLHPWLLVIVAPLGLLLATVLIAALLLPLAVLSVYLYYLAIRLIRALFEPPRFAGAVEHSFSALIGWDNAVDWWRFARADGTYLYEEVGQRLHAYVQANPDPDPAQFPKATPIFAVGAMRGQGEKGRLAPQEQPEASGLVGTGRNGREGSLPTKNGPFTNREGVKS